MEFSPERRPTAVQRLPRRFTDRLEDVAAWLLSSLGLLVLLAAVLVGIRGYADRTERIGLERAPVDAVLLKDAPQRAVTSQAVPFTRVPARYVDQAGQTHVADVPVRGRHTAGATVRVWVDKGGHVTAAPGMRSDTTTAGAARGIGIAVLGGAVLFAARVGVRRYVAARNSAAWAREWARVEPVWSGRERST